MPAITLSTKQVDKCLTIVSEFVALAEHGSAFPAVLLIKLKLLRDMLRDGNVMFVNEDFEFLAVWLDLYFESFDDDDIDPLAEQAYAKIKGEWPILPPWYDRVRMLEGSIGFERDGQEPFLGT